MIKLNIGYEIKKIFPEVPNEAIDFLLTIDESTSTGRRDFGEYCYVNVIETSTKLERGLMEAHEKYIDVQCLVSGEEKILYAEKDGLCAEKEYNPKTDCAFYSFDRYGEVTYRTGEAVVLYPNEAHLPGLAVNEPMAVKKAVLKVKCK